MKPAHVFVEEETITDIDDACRAFNAGKMQGLNRCHGNKTGTVFNDWAQTWSSGWFRQWNIEYLLPPVNRPLLVLTFLSFLFFITEILL